MRRRNHWIGLAFLLALGLLAGCSRGQEPEQGQGEQQSREPEQSQEEQEDETGTDVSQDTPKDAGQWYAKGDEIEGQCFDAVLEPLGAVSFRSYDPGEAAGEYGDAVFLIWKNNAVWQQLDGMTEDNLREGLKVKSVDAVSFGDYNQDGFDDILIISTYLDSQEESVGEVRYYEGSSQGNFNLMRELSGTMTQELTSYTIAGAREYLATEFGLPKEPAGAGTGGNGQSTLDAAEQLDLIAANRELWRGTEDYIDYCYIVTDLDQNGRLEVMNASLQGSGMFTYAVCYEVNAEGTGLDPISQGETEYDAWPDIAVNKAQVHYDSTADAYWYEIDDYMRDGAAKGVTVRMLLTKNGKSIATETLGADMRVSTENSESHTYYNGEGDEIALEEYENVVSRRCQGMEHKTVLFGWLYMEPGEIDLFSEEELRRKLEESWNGFRIS